ncbi:hypothetical protein MMPV_006813 [Pyropia vietnamensis]
MPLTGSGGDYDTPSTPFSPPPSAALSPLPSSPTDNTFPLSPLLTLLDLPADVLTLIAGRMLSAAATDTAAAAAVDEDGEDGDPDADAAAADSVTAAAAAAATAAGDEGWGERGGGGSGGGGGSRGGLFTEDGNDPCLGGVPLPPTASGCDSGRRRFTRGGGVGGLGALGWGRLAAGGGGRSIRGSGGCGGRAVATVRPPTVPPLGDVAVDAATWAAGAGLRGACRATRAAVNAAPSVVLLDEPPAGEGAAAAMATAAVVATVSRLKGVHRLHLYGRRYVVGGPPAAAWEGEGAAVIASLVAALPLTDLRLEGVPLSPPLLAALTGVSTDDVDAASPVAAAALPNGTPAGSPVAAAVAAAVASAAPTPPALGHLSVLPSPPVALRRLHLGAAALASPADAASLLAAVSPSLAHLRVDRPTRPAPSPLLPTLFPTGRRWPSLTHLSVAARLVAADLAVVPHAAPALTCLLLPHAGVNDTALAALTSAAAACAGSPLTPGGGAGDVGMDGGRDRGGLRRLRMVDLYGCSEVSPGGVAALIRSLQPRVLARLVLPWLPTLPGGAGGGVLARQGAADALRGVGEEPLVAGASASSGVVGVAAAAAAVAVAGASPPLSPLPPPTRAGSAKLPAHIEWGHTITPADVKTLLGTDAAAGLRSLVIRDGRGLGVEGWAALASAADLAVLHVTRLPPDVVSAAGGWGPPRLVRLELEAAMWDLDDLASFFLSLFKGLRRGRGGETSALATVDAATTAADVTDGDGGDGGGGGGGGGGCRRPVGLVELVWEHGAPLRTGRAEAVLAAGMASLAATLRRVTVRRCAGFKPTHPALMAVLTDQPHLSLVTDERTR